jgi:hypothetical protein
MGLAIESEDEGFFVWHGGYMSYDRIRYVLDKPINVVIDTVANVDSKHDNIAALNAFVAFRDDGDSLSTSECKLLHSLLVSTLPTLADGIAVAPCVPDLRAWVAGLSYCVENDTGLYIS